MVSSNRGTYGNIRSIPSTGTESSVLFTGTGTSVRVSTAKGSLLVGLPVGLIPELDNTCVASMILSFSVASEIEAYRGLMVVALFLIALL
jgi:hypothetical protein